MADPNLNENETTDGEVKPDMIKRVEENPVEERPVLESPVLENPVEERPVLESPVLESPVLESPVEERPVLESPVVVPPGGVPPSSGTLAEAALKYKNDQKERMKTLVIGAKDRSGSTIKRIFTFGDEYIVYEIETNILSDSIKVWIDSIKEEDNSLIENYDKIKYDFAELKGLLKNADDVDSMKARIGFVLSLGINGKTVDAINALNGLKTEIKHTYNESFKFRMKFLMTAFCMVIFNVILSIVGNYHVLINFPHHILILLFVATGGSIGGLISIFNRLRSISFESNVKTVWYTVYGIERILISMVFGVIVYLAIKTNTIFGFVNTLGAHKDILGFVLFSIVAGFSETLIPTLLINLEQSKDNKTGK